MRELLNVLVDAARALRAADNDPADDALSVVFESLSPDQADQLTWLVQLLYDQL